MHTPYAVKLNNRVVIRIKATHSLNSLYGIDTKHYYPYAMVTGSSNVMCLINI